MFLQYWKTKEQLFLQISLLHFPPFIHSFIHSFSLYWHNHFPPVDFTVCHCTDFSHNHLPIFECGKPVTLGLNVKYSMHTQACSE